MYSLRKRVNKNELQIFWYVSAGYGKSVPGELADPVTFMTNLISSLKLGAPIIISPSMSGRCLCRS